LDSCSGRGGRGRFRSGQTAGWPTSTQASCQAHAQASGALARGRLVWSLASPCARRPPGWRFLRSRGTGHPFAAWASGNRRRGTRRCSPPVPKRFEENRRRMDLLRLAVCLQDLPVCASVTLVRREVLTLPRSAAARRGRTSGCPDRLIRRTALVAAQPTMAFGLRDGSQPRDIAPACGPYVHMRQ
jgi:hypothetical protein